MIQRPGLSKGELEVASMLWEVGPASVRAVHDSLPASKAMDFATVQTYLRRLEKKGYASSKIEGRIRIYAARTKSKTVIRETVDDLLGRLFGGEAMPLMRHLIEDRGIDQSDIAELKDLINRLEREGKRDDS